VKKVMVFLVIAAGIALLEPRARERIVSYFPTLRAATQQRSAKRTVERIALDVQQAADETGLYPQPNEFVHWLRDAERATEDPWGSAYYLELFPDSFVVGSAGPDTRQRSEDDVRLAKFRGPKAAHLQPGYSPPAPPPSGVKASAIRGAKEAAKRNN
jgi:hypothetical protein